MKTSLVALMGLTGSGKTSLINLLLGEEKAKVGHNLQSETSDVASYSLKYGGREIVLIDTPGFDDTNISDREVLRRLHSWLSAKYADGRKLNAIIYLHNITDKRMRGSSLNNLYAFKRLCGDDFFPQILLGTTFWRAVKPSEMAGAAAREAELKEIDEFWKKMISEGATAIRIPDTRPRALGILVQMAGKSPSVLQVQREAVDEGKSFEASAAYQALDTRLAAAEAEHKAELERIAAEAQRKKEEREREAAKLAEELKKRQEEEEYKLREQKRRQKEADEAHRLRMEALRQEEERTRKREEELEKAMQRLKVETTRKEKSTKWKKKVNESLFLIQHATLASGLFRPTSRAYNVVCDNCFENIGVGTFYRCVKCNDGDFDLCSACHAAPNVYCYDMSHFGDMQKFEQTDTQGNCPRVTRPIKPYQQITCNVCYGPCAELYFHCCGCSNGDFDVCLNCVVRGKHGGCPHPYDICTRYIQ